MTTLYSWGLIFPHRKPLHGLLAVYVDDTAAAETNDFVKLTEKISDKCESKQREVLPILFAVIINPDQYGYFLEQNVYPNRTEHLSKDCNSSLFRTTLHRLAWITQTRPLIFAGVYIVTSKKRNRWQVRYKEYNSPRKHNTKHHNAGLKYAKPDNESLKIVL